MGSVAVFVATAVALLLVLALGGSLPDPAPSHFGVDGRADAYMSRHAFVWLMGTLVTLVPTLTWWLVARSARRGTANIPNAQYWFGPEHGEGTRQYLSGLASFLGVLLAAFLGYDFWVLVHSTANGSAGATLDMPLFLGGLGVFLALTIGSAVVVQRHFGRTGG